MLDDLFISAPVQISVYSQWQKGVTFSEGIYTQNENVNQLFYYLNFLLLAQVLGAV